VRRVRANERDEDARVRAISHAIPERRVEPVRSERQLVDPNGSPVVRRRLSWDRGRRPDARPAMRLRLVNVRNVQLGISRTRLLRYQRSVINVTTDGLTVVRLAGVPQGYIIRLDGERVGRSVSLTKGEHRIVLKLPPPPVVAWDPNCTYAVCPDGRAQ
jgi:hypothetical protein